MFVQVIRDYLRATGSDISISASRQKRLVEGGVRRIDVLHVELPHRDVVQPQRRCDRRHISGTTSENTTRPSAPKISGRGNADAARSVAQFEHVLSST